MDVADVGVAELTVIFAQPFAVVSDDEDSRLVKKLKLTELFPEFADLSIHILDFSPVANSGCLARKQRLSAKGELDPLQVGVISYINKAVVLEEEDVIGAANKPAADKIRF
jgi:hypothetical protein